MFFHNYKCTIKVLLKNKALVFWTLAFPLIMGVLFNLAFKDISKNEAFNIIDIAIINNDEFKNNEIFKEAFKTLSDKNNEDRLFKIKYVEEKEAKQLLNDEKIIGYLLLDNGVNVVINNNGIDQTIFKYVSEEINQTDMMVKTLVESEIKNELSNGSHTVDYQKINEDVINLVNASENNTKNEFTNKLDYTMIEYYTLIAMACLYGGVIAMYAINQNLANMTNKGKRVSVAPINKSKLIISSLSASFTIQLIGILMLFLFLVYGIKVDFGSKLWAVVLLALVGSLTGLSLGLFVGTTIKKNDNHKTGILIAITMVGCFLAGMMGITMKYIIDKNLPFINKINPAAIITDGFYSLYYYDNLNRYWINVGSLLIISLVLIVISFIVLRRQKYDSI